MSSIKETERWFIAVVFLISASIFIKAIEQIGIDKIKHLIFGVNVSYIFLAILSGFFSLLIMSKKWHIVVKKVTRVNFKQIVPIYFAGSAIDMIASGSSVGGEPYRAAKLAKIQKKPFSDCLATTITEKIHSIIAFFILSTIAAIWAIFFFEFSPAVAFTFIIGAIFIISNAMILIYFRKEKFLNAINEALDVSLNKIYDSWLFEKLRKKFSTEEKFERKVISTVDSFIKQTHVLCRDKKMLREGVLYGIFALLISTIRFYLIFLAIGEKMTPMLILLVLSLSVLVSMISVIPGTFGLVESITIGLLVSLHIDPAVAATATLIDRFLHYLLSLSLGGASFLYLEKKYI